MEEIKRDVEYGNRTVRVILQFPDESQDTAMIQKSVKSILMLELEEQMKGGLARKNQDKD